MVRSINQEFFMFTRPLLILAADPVSTRISSDIAMKSGVVKITPLFDQPFPNMPGKSMRAVLVDYAPAATAAHRHSKSALIYATVLKGAVRVKAGDDPERIYQAGESLLELPCDGNGVSANASDDGSALLVAVFLVDTDERNLISSTGD